jgi:uroporphyrinogen III methyltransferase/synthase
LGGWRILVTRPADQIPPFAAALEAAGAEAVVYPTITVEPPPSWEALDGALKKIAAYQWVIFTSPSAVRFTLARAGATDASGTTLPPFAGLKVAAVGAQTARALAAAGIAVDVVPDSDQRQEGLLASLTALPPGTRVLFPQALGGRDLLAQRLTEQGCLVDVVPVSRTTALPLTGGPPPFDVAVFASPSAFRAFVDGHGLAPLGGRLIAAIGPTTAAAIADAGVTVDVIPAAPSAAAMVSALIAFRRHRRATPV